MNIAELLTLRYYRWRRKAKILLRDIKCSANWHIFGGKRFFTQFYPELANSHKWCFIVGCNNSGTSLLQRILENTGQVSTLPYEGQLYTRVLKRDDNGVYARVWSEYIAELEKHQDDDIEKDARRLLHDWMYPLATPVKPIIVEKTPANIARIRWLQKAFPNSYFIGMVRNGYAVVEGIRRKGGKPIERGARHWNFVNKLMLDEAKHVQHYLEIKYEDLVDDPQACAAKLSEFLGIEIEHFNNALNHVYNVYNLHGEPMPIRNLNSDSIANLTQDEILRIKTLAYEMVNHHGYQPK